MKVGVVHAFPNTNLVICARAFTKECVSSGAPPFEFEMVALIDLLGKYKIKTNIIGCQKYQVPEVCILCCANSCTEEAPSHVSNPIPKTVCTVQNNFGLC